MKNRLLPAARLGQDWTALIPGAVATPTADASQLSVIDACSEYVQTLEDRYGDDQGTATPTLSAYRTPVTKHLLPFLAYVDGEEGHERALAEVNEVLVGQFTKAKQRERVLLQDVADTLSELDDETLCDREATEREVTGELGEEAWRLLYRYGQAGGRRALSDPRARGRISLSSRGLGNNEINRCLARLRDIVKMANRRYRLDIPDPTVDCALPRDDPSRNWLRPRQLQAVFDAARELDARAPVSGGPDYRQLGREAAMVVLGLAGPRVSELCMSRFQDSYATVLRIPEAKTTAGKREIRLHPLPLAMLRQRQTELGQDGDGFIFATATGRRRDRASIRTRILGPVLARAREIHAARAAEFRAEHGFDPAPFPETVTPHTFRRTYLTYCAWANLALRFTQGQAGHKSSKLTLECYQQPLPDDPEEEAMVLEWLRL